jgi:hypothetical protein
MDGLDSTSHTSSLTRPRGNCYSGGISARTLFVTRLRYLSLRCSGKYRRICAGGYRPRPSGRWRAILLPALISGLAEVVQIVAAHRTSSIVDFGSNMLGAILGLGIAAYWLSRCPRLVMNNWTALFAALMAIILISWIWITGGSYSARGSTSPGTLEARWNFDDVPGSNTALDSSGNGLGGRLRNGAVRVAGVREQAIRLDGLGDYVDIGHSRDLRLVGSMTIAAWIRPASFPP